MSYWNAFAKKYPSRALLRLDGGSIFMRGGAAAPVVNRYMLEGTFRSNLDAVNVSAWDLPVWREMGDLVAAGMVSRDFLKIPLVSANLSTKLANFPAIQRYVIKEFQVDPKRGKPLRIAITGLLSDPEGRISRQDFQIQKPQDAAYRILSELNSKSDYVIILTDMDLGQVISLAVQVPGIHMIIVAHDYSAPTDPQQVGDTLVLSPVNEGRMLTEMRMNFRSGAPHGEIESHTVPLDRSVPDDPVMGELIRRAQAEIDRAQK
jgi:hypothetical protein